MRKIYNALPLLLNQSVTKVPVGGRRRSEFIFEVFLRHHVPHPKLIAERHVYFSLNLLLNLYVIDQTFLFVKTWCGANNNEKYYNFV
jgi:hypothetical protein